MLLACRVSRVGRRPFAFLGGSARRACSRLTRWLAVSHVRLLGQLARPPIALTSSLYVFVVSLLLALAAGTMRLTAELIKAAPGFMNPIKGREICMRGEQRNPSGLVSIELTNFANAQGSKSRRLRTWV
jgi:hypothetical protein